MSQSSRLRDYVSKQDSK